MSESPSRPATRRAHCNRCLHSTNHEILFTESKHWEEDLDDEGQYRISGSDTYSLLRCAGCDQVRFLHEHWFSEELDEEGRQIRHADYYPPKVTRQKPEWTFLGLPMKLGMGDFGALIDEIYRALGAGALRLATMGIRSLVERMMVDRVGDQQTFEKNIQAFFDAGYVAKIQQDTFRDILVEAGHAAMHRDWEPTLDDVNTLLDITEGVLKTVYVDPRNAEKVSRRIPARKRPPKRDGQKVP